jgi:AbrB family looped-hinge helix DNA binding protein
MKRAFSKITTKSQTTVPKAVRSALRLAPGDAIVYEVEGTTVTLRRAERPDAAYLGALRGTLSEWESPEDAAAFDDL